MLGQMVQLSGSVWYICEPSLKSIAFSKLCFFLIEITYFKTDFSIWELEYEPNIYVDRWNLH